ncbi:MAG: hypothetical protein Q8909_18825 [Bacteroidota bacterium]|nr:hypothetical protein [Bacteroidota bacterium]
MFYTASLGRGNIVRLGDFGSFNLIITGEGQETADKVTSKTINSSKVQFRPGKEVKNQLGAISYEKLAGVETAIPEEPQA